MVTSWKSDAKNVVIEFLRTKMTDPRARAEATGTDTFTATSGQTLFTLTPSTGMKAYAIKTVTVDSVSKTKWRDYTIDLQNQTITLTTGATTGQTVVVTYKEGTSNWIFPNLVRNTLSVTSYPRISLFIVSEPGEQMGNYTAPLYHTIHFQMDVWVKDGYTYTDNSVIHSSDELAVYLARRAISYFRNNIDDMYPELFDFRLINLQDAKWENDKETHHCIVDFELNGVDIGE